MKLYHIFRVNNDDEEFPIDGLVHMEIVIQGTSVRRVSWYMMFEGQPIKPVWVTKEMIEAEKKNALKSKREGR